MDIYMDAGSDEMVQNPDEIIDILTKPNFDDNDYQRDTTRTNFEINVRKYTREIEYDEMDIDHGPAGPNNINCQSNQESDLKPFKIHQNRAENFENFENIDINLEPEQTLNTINNSNVAQMVLDYKIDIREEESAGESYLVSKTNNMNVNLSSIQNSKIISSRNTQSRREKKNLKRKLCHRCWKYIILNSSTRHICKIEIDNESTRPPTYACTLCPNKYFYRDSVRRHLRNNHIKEISGVKDYTDFFVVLSENKTMSRVRKSKNKIRVEIEQDDENKEVFQSQNHSPFDEDPLNFIVCAICANCIDGKDYEQHLKVVHTIGKMDESKRICDRCRGVIDLNSSDEHICKIYKNKSTELTNYACKLCRSKYHNRNSVRRHLLNKHKKIMSSVENISDFIIFTSKNNQKSNEGSNSTVQTRMTSKSKYSNSSHKICSICTEICIDRRDHLDHLKNAHGIDVEGNFKCPLNLLNCPVCGKVMTYMYSLRRHLTIQHAGYIDGIVQKKLKERENQQQQQQQQQQQESNINNVPVKIYQPERGGGEELMQFYLIVSPLQPPTAANNLQSNKRILISENDEEQLSLNKLSRVKCRPNLDPETFPILCTFSGCGYRFKTQHQKRNHNKIIHKGLRFRCTVSGCTNSDFKYKIGLIQHLQKSHLIELDKEAVLKLTPTSTIPPNLEDLDPLGNFSLQSYCRTDSSDNEPRVHVNTEFVQNNEIQDNMFDSFNSTLIQPMEYKPQFPSEFTQNDAKSVQDEEIQDNFFDFLNLVPTVPIKKSNNKPQFSSKSTQKEHVKKYKKKTYLNGKFFCNEIVDGVKCTKVCREQRYLDQHKDMVHKA